MEIAHQQGFSCVAIVVECDGPKNRERLSYLEKGRELALHSGNPLAESLCLGVAIECVEAWLLADEAALNRALCPPQPIPRSPNPEKIWGPARTAAHPKGQFRQWMSSGTVSMDVPTAYQVIASDVSLVILEQRCPQGFARFANELRKRAT